ncbi:hypothetical protein F6V30_15745 [Oryzomonas sagensis]|uniref:Glycosyltransferase RgtA/B/C/D-like domain-containing protein n=1 Tax=Oryzomonas sagensis TaxID=2603857 RepID=A0ABQ6TKE1_9BACT|nr:hypothetical protein [Oryzomonas sagensis]KAB0668552.1 hypothetical protein F6V30_15745 [Oryzomonas sagensis]
MTMKSLLKARQYLIPRISDVLFGAVLLYTAVFAGMRMLGDGDTGYHVRAGELMLKSGTILHLDPFSYIWPQLPWTAHEWLAEIIMALCHHVAGLPGVVLLFSLVIAVTNLLFFRMLRDRGAGILLSSAVLLLFIAAAKVHWLARPHIFSLFFMISWYIALEKLQDGERIRAWLLPASMVLWVNLHGGYIVGIFLICLYLAGNLSLSFIDRSAWDAWARQRVAILLKILGGSLVAALLNPLGYKIFLFPFQLAMDKTLMDSVQEFLSPNFHEPQMLKYLLFIMVAVLVASRRRMPPVHLILILFFLNMALYSVRYTPLFAMVFLPIITRHLDTDDLERCFPRITRFFRRREATVASVDALARGGLWPVLVTLAVTFFIVSGKISYRFDPTIKPVAALEFLKRERVTGNVFNNDEFGDVTIYMLADRYKVFIDGRLDMYHSAGILKEYFKVTTLQPGWEAVLNKYAVGWFFFDTNSVLARFLQAMPGWKLIYSDKVASIFVKNSPEYQYLIEKYPHMQLAVIDEIKK